VEIPINTRTSNEIFYLGVRLNKLLENCSWFYNYRLPTMDEYSRLKFLKEDVDYETLLEQESRDISRINDYMEVRDEINEDAFAILSTNHTIDPMYTENLAGRTVFDMFKQTMEEVVLPTTLTEHVPIKDWAEQVEEEENEEMDNFKQQLDEQEQVGVVRSLGYKKKGKNKSMFTIGSLQQGSILKNRVLNCFFDNQDVKNERLRQLPHMYIYCTKIAHNPESSRFFSTLLSNLSDLIIDRLSVNTGSPSFDIREKLDKQLSSYEIPIQMVEMMQGKVDSRVTMNLFDLISKEQDIEDYGEYQSDSDESLPGIYDVSE
jgi:hypothetical protein